MDSSFCSLRSGRGFMNLKCGLVSDSIYRNIFTAACSFQMAALRFSFPMELVLGLFLLLEVITSSTTIVTEMPSLFAVLTHSPPSSLPPSSSPSWDTWPTRRAWRLVMWSSLVLVLLSSSTLRLSSLLLLLLYGHSSSSSCSSPWVLTLSFVAWSP